MRDDDKHGKNLSIPTIPGFADETDAATRVEAAPAELREIIAQHKAEEHALSAPTIPTSFTVPGLPPVAPEPETKPGAILVDDLIADSLRSARIRQRAPTLSSILGPPAQPDGPERTSLSSLAGLADQLPPSLRDPPGSNAAPPTETKPGGSGTKFLVALLVVAILGAGAVIAIVFRSGFH